MKQSLLLIAFLLAIVQLSFAQKDCCEPLPLQGGAPNTIFLTDGSGKVDDVSCSCLSGEGGSIWYSFTATVSGTFEMIIEPTSQPTPNFDFAIWRENCPCNNGSPLPPPIAISCNSEVGPGPTGIADHPDFTFGVPNSAEFSPTIFLQAGLTYFLLVSNVSNTGAGFVLTTAGTAAIGPQQPESFGLAIAGPTEICEGGTATFTTSANSSQLPVSFSWEVTPGGPVVPSGPNQFVDLDFPAAGTYDVCVTAYTAELGCFGSLPSCMTVNVAPIPNPSAFESAYVCLGSEYVAGNGEVFYFGGTFDLVYQSWQGCDSIVRLTLTQVISPYIIVNQVVCEGTCVEFNGETYCDGGFYEHILPSQFGCDSTTVLNLISVPIETIITGADTIDCNTPSIVLSSVNSVFGNNPQYTWRRGNTVVGTNPTLTVTTGGTYTLTIQSSFQNDTCLDVSSVVILQNTELPQGVTATGGIINCNSSTVTLLGTSSTPMVTYSWTGPNGYTSNQQNPTVSAAGSYTLTVTAPNGCKKTAIAMVTINQAVPNAVATTNGVLNCNASTVLLSGAGSSNGVQFSYLWTTSNGNIVSDPTTLTPLVAAAGTYVLTVTNNTSGCTNTASTVVIERTAVTANIIATTNISCFGEAGGAATVVASGGNGNYLYTWSSGATTATVSNLNAGTYTVVVTDGEGCTGSQTVTLTQPPVLLTNATATPQTTFGVDNGTATANPTGGTGAYSYSWTDENGNSVGSSSMIVDLAPGNYTVVVSDENGCTAAQTVTVSDIGCIVKANTDQQNVSCPGASDGSATINLESATPPFSFLWSTGETTQTITGLAGGTYAVSSTDANGCEVVSTVVIEEAIALNANVTVTDLTGINSNDGTATANPTGGTAPFTYLWDNGEVEQTIDELAPGDYTVVVTDFAGCQATQTVTVQPYDCGMSTSIVFSNIDCNGDATGQATVVLVGGVAPFTYNWSNGGTTATIMGLTAGTYTATVMDATGCPGVVTANITEPTAIEVGVVQIIETDCMASNGSITISPSGGIPGYSLLWSTGETTTTISGLDRATYTVSVTDANNCEVPFDIKLGVNDDVPPVVFTQDITLMLDANGQATALPAEVDNGSTDDCEIDFLTLDQTTFDCSDLGTNNVMLTVTDVGENSVSGVAVVTVLDNTAPILLFQDVTLDISAGIPVILTPQQVDNGSSDNCGITEWTLSQTVFGCDNAGPNTITVTATDASGNMSTATVVVTAVENIAPVLDCPEGISLPYCDPIGEFAVTATDNCVGAVSVMQTAGPVSGSTFPTGSTTVSFVATDLSGNTANCSFTVAVPVGITLSVVADNVNCFGDDDGSATATATGGSQPYTYLWSNGATTATANGLQAGTYSVSVTDGGGCTEVQTVTLSQPPVFSVALVNIINATTGQQNGSVDVSVTGGVAPYTYTWKNAAGATIGNMEDISGLGAGTYTLSVIDANGCISLSAYTIQSTSATNETDLDSQVLLYPNPTQGLVILQMVELTNVGEFSVSAFDVTGRAVLNQSFTGSRQTLDFSSQPSGIYLLKIVVGNQQLTKRLVVTR